MRYILNKVATILVLFVSCSTLAYTQNYVQSKNRIIADSLFHIKEYSKALIYYGLAIEEPTVADNIKGHCCNNIAYMYLFGKGVPQKTETAIEHLTDSYSIYKNRYAAHLLAIIYSTPTYGCLNKKKAWELLLKCGYEEDDEALQCIGDIYRNGYTKLYTNLTVANDWHYIIKDNVYFDFVAKNQTRAIEAYDKAYYNLCFMELSDIAYWLASQYSSGEIVEQNFYKARHYFEKYIPRYLDSYLASADSEEKVKVGYALWNLQKYYRFGIGGISNMAEAEKMLRYSAKCGNINAIKVLK